MRLFIGIPLSAGVRAELAAVVAELHHAAPNLRWTAPEMWHITLQFLGSTAAEQFDCLKARLPQVKAAPVPLRLASLGAFERAGIVYVDVEQTPALLELQQQVTAATAHCGFAPEERPFHPHITLARAKGRARFRGVPAPRSWHENPPQFTPFEAREFLLYESFTQPSGAHHEIRVRFPLSP
jgi:2'-5' RNA ligase